MKRKLIIIGILTAILLIVGLLTWPLPRLLAEGFISWADTVFGHTALLKTLGIAAAIVLAFALALVFVLPILVYIFKKIYFYVSVFFLCLFHRYRFRVTRPPFASLGGASDKSDIEITTDEGILCIHFIDIVFPYRRALTIPNPQEYIVTPTSKGRIVREGGGSTLPHMQGARTLFFRAKDRTLDKKRDRKKSLPSAVSSSAATKHALLLLSLPNESRYIENGASVPLAGGLRVGHLTILTTKYLKRGLKGQLYTSFFDESATHRK